MLFSFSHAIGFFQWSVPVKLESGLSSNTMKLSTGTQLDVPVSVEAANVIKLRWRILAKCSTHAVCSSWSHTFCYDYIWKFVGTTAYGSFAVGLHLICSKSCLLFFLHCSKNLPIMGHLLLLLSRKLPRRQIASLASRWYLHFLFISGGCGAFTISSRLALTYLSIVWDNYRFIIQLRRVQSASFVAKLLHIPRPCVDWEWVADRKMLSMHYLFPHYARCLHMA